MAINFPNDPATNPGDGGGWTDPDGNLWQVEIIAGEAIWTMVEAADTGGGGGGDVTSVNSQTGAVELGVSDMIDVDTNSTTEINLAPTTEAPYFCTGDGQFNIIADVQSTGPFINIWGLGSDATKFNKLTIGDSLIFAFPDGVTFSTTYAGDLGPLVNNELSVKIGDPWPDEILPGGGVLQPVNGPAFIKVISSKFNWIEDGQYIAWDDTSSKFQALQPPRSGSDLDQVLARSGNAAYYYVSPPSLGDDATDTTVPTMGQVRAAIASNGGTSVSLNDLTDVNYTQKGTDDSWTLEPINLDEILFTGQDTPEGVNRKVYIHSTYGMALTSYDANSGTYIYAHESKGIVLRTPTDNGVVWIDGRSGTVTSQPEIRISNGNGVNTTPTGNYIGFKMPAGVAANVTWTLPAVDGAASSVLTSDGAGNLTFEPIPTVAAPASLYEIGYEGLTAYKFTGPGLDGTELNPAIYVVRGQKYVFNNVLGAHPFQLQTVAGTGESPYIDGVTGDQPIDLGSFEWEVPMDAPSTLYYQCTAHTAMSGVIYVLDNSGGGGAGAVESVNSQTGVVSLGIQDMDDYALKAESGLYLWDGGSETSSTTNGEFGSERYKGYSNVDWQWYHFYVGKVDKNGSTVVADWIISNLGDNTSIATFILKVPGLNIDTEISGVLTSNYSGNYLIRATRNVGVNPDQADWLGLTGSNPFDGYEVEFYPKELGSLVAIADDDVLQWNSARSKFEPAQLSSVATSGDYNDLINAPSAGDAPVTSVNTETGDVSLGIQDMDDFEFANASDPAYQYYFVYSFQSGTINSAFYDEPGQCLAYENGSIIYCYNDGASDSSGSDLQPDFPGSAASAGWVNATTVTFWLKKENEQWTQHAGTYEVGGSYFRISNISPPFQQCDGIINSALGTSLYISAFDPANTPKKPLANQDILQWDSVAASFVPTQLDYSQINNTPAPLARTTVEITTAALAIGATEAGEIAGTGASGLLISAQTNVAAWIRIYTSATTSTNDASRDKDTDPVPGSGVLFEALYTTFTEKPITPGTTYFNLAGDSKLYYRITNESAIDGTPITATFKILPLE